MPNRPRITELLDAAASGNVDAARTDLRRTQPYRARTGAAFERAAQRQVLLDIARKHATDKYGGGYAWTERTEGIENTEPVDELLAVEAARSNISEADRADVEAVWRRPAIMAR